MKFIYFFLFVALAYASEKREVELRTQLEAGRAVPLMLEDLVGPAKVPADLLNIEVPFKEKTIARNEILNWLKDSKNERRELVAYAFKIPQSIAVEWTENLSIKQISNRAKNRLQQKCTDCDFRVLVKNLPQVSGDKNIVQWRELPLAGPFMVSVANPDGGGRSWVSGQIKTERKIVSANRALRPGDTIQSEDLKMESFDISYNKDYFADMKQVIGRKAARVISTQTPLTSLDIQRHYDIKQGETIKAISGNEVFEVTLQAIAQDSGVVGDSIRVRNVSNQKILTGRVLDKGLVRIE